MQDAQERLLRLRILRQRAQQLLKLAVQSSAHQFINVEALTVKKAGQRHLSIARGLHELRDEEGARSELLHDQIACRLIGLNLIASRERFQNPAGLIIAQRLKM